MNRESSFNKHFENVLQLCMMWALWGIACLFPLHAEAQKASLPDPATFLNKFDIVGNVVYAVLDDMGFNIELDSRKTGKIATRPLEFISGTLTSNEIEKYAVKNDIRNGSWLKARYSVEAILEIVTPTSTIVTIRTNVEALNRSIDGSEKWIRLESLGTLEKRILGKISMKLMGNEAPSNQKKGFWDQEPKPVDPRQLKPITNPYR